MPTHTIAGVRFTKKPRPPGGGGEADGEGEMPIKRPLTRCRGSSPEGRALEIARRSFDRIFSAAGVSGRSYDMVFLRHKKASPFGRGGGVADGEG